MLDTQLDINPEAAESALREALTATGTNDSAKPGQPESPTQQAASPAKVEGEKKPDLTQQNDTRSEAEAKHSEPQETSKETEAKTEDKASPFKRNQDRLEKTWKAVNERKTTLDSQESALNQRKAELDAREQQIAAKAAKADSKFSPEQYEQAAATKLNGISNFEIQADGLEARAAKLESDGKYGEAERCKEQAAGLRAQATADKVMAQRMREYAQHLRANPDPTAAQLQQQKTQALSHWTVEAAKSYPELAAKGSPFQTAVANALQEAAKNGLDVNEHPSLMFHAAKMVALQTAAERVPNLEKEVGKYKARVKELEGLTSPSGGQGAAQATTQPKADFASMTLDQQESWLRQNVGR